MGENKENYLSQPGFWVEEKSSLRIHVIWGSDLYHLHGQADQKLGN